MARMSFAKTVSDARVMAAGIESRRDALSSIALGAEDAAELKSLAESADGENNNQERLKAELKTCTAALEATLEEILSKMQVAKKKIKAVIPQEDWKTFGIEDKGKKDKL